MLAHTLHASFADEADQRVSDRRVLRLDARAATPAGAGDIAVHNLSRTGMLVECASDLAAGAHLELALPGGSTHGATVVWSDDRLIGCRFDQPLSQAQLSAALLRSDPVAGPEAQAQLSQDQAIARLREHWAFEPDTRGEASPPKLAIGLRLWIIGGLAVAGWSVPLAAAWLLV